MHYLKYFKLMSYDKTQRENICNYENVRAMKIKKRN